MPGIFEMLASDPAKAPVISYERDSSGAWCEVIRRGSVKAPRRLRPAELSRITFLGYGDQD